MNNNLKTKTKRAAAMLLMLLMLAPLAAWAQNPDCNGPVAITADTPYIEDFESPQGTIMSSSGPMPDCWDGYNNWLNPLNTYNSSSHGQQSLVFYHHGDSYAILPEFSTAINLLKISFLEEYGNGLQLGYITAADNGTSNTFTAIADYTAFSDWVQYTNYLFYVPATAHRLAFKYILSLSILSNLSIDDVEVSVIPLGFCYPVGNLGLGRVASNSAYLSWELMDNNQTAWDVQVATDANFTENVANLEADSHENYLVEGLDPDTYYYVRVKPSCSADLWSNTIQFWTMPPCNGQITVTADAPYTEGFENPVGTNYNVLGRLPACWESFTTGSVGPHNTTAGSANVHGGTQYLSFNSESGTDTYYAILPEFSNPLNELQISFWLKYSWGLLQLGYITAEDEGNCNTFTAIADFGAASTWTQHSAYLLYVPEAAHRLAFKWSESVMSGFIDDVEVSICALDCFPVGNLSVEGLSSTSAYLSWELFDDSQTAWNVQLATDAAFTNILADEETDSHENYLLEGLSIGTYYYVRVKPTCTDDLWNVLEFALPCAPITVTTATPYTQGFETPEGTAYNMPGPLPLCWESYIGLPHNSFSWSHGGTQSLAFYNDGGAYAMLPEFSNPLNQLQVSFWMKTDSNNGTLQLGYLTAEDDGIGNTFTEIADYGSIFGSMVQRSTTLENVPATAHRLAFKWSATYYRCFVDDVEVSINPALIVPHDIAASNITPHEADITWEGYCDSYALRYREIPTLLKEGFEGGTMPEGWTIEGDNQDPAKTWRVGVGDHSNGTGTHSGNYNALITQNARNQVTYLVTPALDLGEYASAELSFWYVNRIWSNRTDEFAVCYRIGSEGGWTELWSTAENHESWTSQTVALTGLGDNCQIGFRYTDHYGWGVGLDDIVLCDPTHFEWIAVGEAESPHTLTGLTTETTYEVQVKSNCAGYDDWSESVVFTTLEACPVPFNVAVSGITATSAAVSWTGFNDSYNLSYRRAPIAETPLNEGFEGGTIPQGWTIEGDNQDPAKTWRIGVGDNNSETGTHSGNYNALITHNRNNQVTYLVTPALDLGEYGSMELSFWYINRKWVNDIDEFAVCYRIGNEGGWNELWSTAENHDTWTSQTVALTGLADNYQIGFRFTDLFGYGVGLDDVVLFDMTHSEWIILSEAESPHTLTGLLPETEYEVKVQGVCDGEATKWSESTYFTTLEGTTFTKDIIAHTDNGGWYLIASPVAEAITPTAQNGFLANEYDLYRFNQSAELEWENWKAEGEHYHFNLEAGRGYLYANSGDVTLTFVGTPLAATEPVEVPLAYDPAAEFAGWNLVGNPFGQTAYIADGRPFYTMNDDGNEIVGATSNGIEAMKGIFVVAEADGETMAFTTEEPAQSVSQMVVNVTRSDDNRGLRQAHAPAVIDRAIIRFGDSQALPKFQLNPNNTKVYIPQGGKDYAVVAIGRDGACTVSTNGTGCTDGACTVSTAMPLNFKAEKDGTYTLSFNLENMDLDYLHLIDNFTGADVDLLSVPEPVEGPKATGTGPSTSSGPGYTFTAKTTDYASRFRLVFTANPNCGDAIGDNAPFAYISNGNIVITTDIGDATLQIVDMMGRVIVSVSGDVSGNVSTAGMPTGVYVLRLIDGDTVRTQKIVIQ